MPDPPNTPQQQSATPTQSQTLAKMIRSKYPGAYDDMDDMTLEKNVLAKYPQYKDLPLTTPESQAPNAAMQAHRLTQQAIPTAAADASASYPGAQKGLSPYTQAGQNQAKIGENYNNYMQQSGSMAGQMAGGMATGGLFPALKGAGVLKNVLPFLGRTAASGAGMGAGALAGGANPQEAKQAAIAGVAGQPIAEGAGAFLNKIAPSMAESALNVTDRMRGRGRTIGQAVLENTSGVRPSTLAGETAGQVSSLSQQMENAVHQATQSGAVGSTTPAHQVLNSALQSLPRNARAIQSKMSGLGDLLDLDGTGRTDFTPDELLEMKRGIGKEISTWPPEWQKLPDVKQVQQRLYGAIDGELDRLVPGNSDINQKISSLIPAKQQAARISDSATTAQRIAHRVAAHTGALTGSGIGGYLGYREGGPKGAAIGAAAGLALPELLASPTAQMTGARLASATGQGITSPTVLPFLKTIASQKKAKQSDEEQ